MYGPLVSVSSKAMQKQLFVPGYFQCVRSCCAQPFLVQLWPTMVATWSARRALKRARARHRKMVEHTAASIAAAMDDIASSARSRGFVRRSSAKSKSSASLRSAKPSRLSACKYAPLPSYVWPCPWFSPWFSSCSCSSQCIA